MFLLALPRVYGFSTLGRLADLALFAVPFVLATSFMGPAAGSLFSHPEKAVRVFVATIVQQFSLVVVSWPREGGLAVPVAPHHGRPGGACGASTDFA